MESIEYLIEESKKALLYLAATDYLIIKHAELGTSVPQDIKDARAAARLKVLK